MNFSERIIVRDATPADAAGIAAVHVRAWQAAYRGIMPDDFLNSLSVEDRLERWRKNLANPMGSTCVADWKGEIRGWVGYGACRDADLPEAGEIYGIYVDPDHWGFGIGRRLMATASDRLTALEMSPVVLWVLEANRRPRQFYERAGFALDDAVKTLTYGGRDVRACRYRRA